MIVVDASDGFCARGWPASAVEQRLLTANETHYAPDLIDIEVATCRYALAGDMSAERGREALEDLADLSLRRYPHEVLLSRVGVAGQVVGPDAI